MPLPIQLKAMFAKRLGRRLVKGIKRITYRPYTTRQFARMQDRMSRIATNKVIRLPASSRTPSALNNIIQNTSKKYSARVLPVLKKLNRRRAYYEGATSVIGAGGGAGALYGAGYKVSKGKERSKQRGFATFMIGGPAAYAGYRVATRMRRTT